MRATALSLVPSTTEGESGWSRPTSPSRTLPVQSNPFWPGLIATLGRQSGRVTHVDGMLSPIGEPGSGRIVSTVPIYRSIHRGQGPLWGNKFALGSRTLDARSGADGR